MRPSFLAIVMLGASGCHGLTDDVGATSARAPLPGAYLPATFPTTLNGLRLKVTVTSTPAVNPLGGEASWGSSAAPRPA